MSVSKKSRKAKGSAKTASAAPAAIQAQLEAIADSPMTEIFVINDQFARVEKGLGKLTVSLSPGLYKVKFKAGNVIHEVLADVVPGPPVVVRCPPMEFSTSVPLANTSTTRGYHEGQARSLSLSAPWSRGVGSQSPGSQLFIYLRDLEHKSKANPAVGLTLHDADGKLVADFLRECRFDDSVEIPYAGCTIELGPGVYRLRIRAGEAGSLEQSIVLCRGWQTQVFLLRRSYGYKRKLRRPDLPNASIHMAPLGRGFDPGTTQVRWGEIARFGLVNQRPVMAEEELRRMLHGKCENPMLGIMGGHLLLLAETPDCALVREVVLNLHKLIGAHPDVAALNLWLGNERVKELGDAVYPVPPMLRSSWQLIIQESAHRPEIVPAGSLAARVANQLWNEGAWLVWQAPEKTATAWPTEGLSLASLESLLPQLGIKLQGAESLTKLAARTGLNDLEIGLLHQMSGMLKSEDVANTKASDAPPSKSKSRIKARQTSFSAPAITIAPTPPSPSSTKLVEALGVPQTSIYEAISGLASKLKLKL